MEYKDMKFTGERALFGEQNAVINGCVFESGESPCKECRNITATESLFRYKYPFWYGTNISLDQVTFFEMARAGIWYTDHISVSNSIIEGPKNFRRCHDVKLSNVLFSNALETLWSCTGVTMENVKARGPYFAMNCRDVKVDGLDLIGVLPQDELVYEFDCEGKPSAKVPDDAPVKVALKSIMETLSL